MTPIDHYLLPRKLEMTDIRKAKPLSHAWARPRQAGDAPVRTAARLRIDRDRARMASRNAPDQAAHASKKPGWGKFARRLMAMDGARSVHYPPAGVCAAADRRCRGKLSRSVQRYRYNVISRRFAVVDIPNCRDGRPWPPEV